ncbi:MAG: aldehyde dehydrogenase family protein [Flavobacteriales bacterium AspAUS03]
METFDTINPANGDTLNTYTYLTEVELSVRLSLSSSAYKGWKCRSFQDRAQCIAAITKKMGENIKSAAQLITQEMGKPIAQARAEIHKCIDLCQYYLGLSEAILAIEHIPMDNYSKSYVRFDPIGAILGIMPWNFPFWQVFRYSIPNLLIGNTILLKHAPNTTACGLFIENLFIETGLPEGIFQALLIDIPQVETVIAHAAVQGITLTGSNKAGSIVASLAGKYIKKSTLELGGNDAFIVMKDADLKNATQIAAAARLNNTGQTCISAKRFVVDQAIATEFIEAVIEEMKAYSGGNLYDEHTKLGFISRTDLAEKLLRQYCDAVINGAKVCLQTQREGNFFSPALLQAKSNNPILKEELFGPIGLVLTFSSESEMLRLVNDTPYGLSASIWTQDLDKAEVLTKEIDTGMVFVNEMVRSYPSLPFGGVKQSGYGRELSTGALKEFLNWKTVVIK